MTKRKKMFYVQQWSHRERTVTYSKMLGDEKNFHLSCGYFFPIDKSSYSPKILSRVQKNVRQFLYHYLDAKGIKGRYVVAIEGPASLSSNHLFVDLQIYCPCTENDKELVEKIIDRLFDEMGKFI